jgi:hypothetical protein
MRETCTILFAPDKELLQVSLPVEILGVLWAGPWQLRYRITVETQPGNRKIIQEKAKRRLHIMLPHASDSTIPF